ncbi:MAG: hypothetical protein UR39_C0010G0042 [Candidatus Woesebacteria bacterium GW2011_GWA1_33_30]|uniref:YoaR-like putative peptidoglycan binding domain-containing protein n=1 Tax=Candidatus Woesebacteria bacterium GW2011_GWA2_33_28 TaxID=1618561 RepID=A0A0G0C5L2_9BACT|nr:MAG: hypothetical protein UR38_C0010G0041 [Candidatus Woesebacteria bacterium GW2011_GWA2_33_28]KKP47300.1 MAG: hypothetical protein UR39_C0010G0042 [Candidatus Woesebacteria bacterium GW2011_GWA1_33_30]KKP48945.1 MAG: hypothetical protein UR40_C0011G0041 [Microgenomates group bacterium GW2011_GWC1_33_32]KKP51483.1 MAG: hypothetical protein UR44_C0010G0041 [Candidatus Woesebacteria bacterium GW2011_GWB1_33_38]
MTKIFIYFCVALLFFILIITIPFVNKIYLNIYVAGTYIGDKSKEEAVYILSEKIKVPEKITFKINGVNYEILTSEIDLSYDVVGSVERAYNYPNKLKLIFKPVNLGLKLNFEKEKLTESLLIISSKTGTEPIKPSVKIVNDAIVVNPGKNGVEIDINEIESKILSNISLQVNEEFNFNTKEVDTSLKPTELENYKMRATKLIGKEIIFIFEEHTIKLSDNDLLELLDPKGVCNQEAIEDQIEKASRTVNRNPQDSVFIVENNIVKEFTPSKDGITINEDKLVENIWIALNSLLNSDSKAVTLDIPVIIYPAKIKNEDVNDLGINTLLGRGDSNFKGSIANRIYNVNLAQSRFKGVLIPPNEEVSFNNILGDVSSLTGYKAAYVIKDGKTVLGDGGGVCQVSTTLFRALLSAGLPILERRAHAYRVGYYEQGFPPGLDATVYSPTTDLKFKNDTPAYILIQPTINLTNLTFTFEIYGTNDGRVATTTKPIITSQTAPPPDLYVDDPTLPTGTIKQIEHKAWGAKVVFDYKVVRNGETLIDQKFVSNYRSWQAVYLRGTGI